MYERNLISRKTKIKYLSEECDDILTESKIGLN